MKRTLLLSIIALVAAGLFAQYPGGDDPYGDGYGTRTNNGHDHHNDDYHSDDQTYGQKRVQIALILDASGSMKGLINQAKSQFWSILNELSYSYDGAYPMIEVSVFDFGSKYASPQNGYIRQLTPLTSDLDWAADELYKIRVGGRYEYPGLAIQKAVDELHWDRNYDVDKMIFIAGNESMDKGRTDFRRSIRNAKSMGINVHAIFCGDYDQGINHGWADAAYFGSGMYSALNHNAYDYRSGYAQDRDLWRLNADLNGTYIPYGANGADYCERMRRQDRNSYGYGMNYAAQRVIYKSRRSYRCPRWDLVDAVRMGRIDIRVYPAANLPIEMRRMSIAQRQAYINKKAAKRDGIRRQMQQLATVRQEAVKREERNAGRAGTAGTATRAGVTQGRSGSTTNRPVMTQSLSQAVRQSVGKKLSTKPVPSRASSSIRPSSTTPSTGNRGTVGGTPAPRRQPSPVVTRSPRQVVTQQPTQTRRTTTTQRAPSRTPSTTRSTTVRRSPAPVKRTTTTTRRAPSTVTRQATPSRSRSTTVTRQSTPTRSRTSTVSRNPSRSTSPSRVKKAPSPKPAPKPTPARKPSVVKKAPSSAKPAPSRSSKSSSRSLLMKRN